MCASKRSVVLCLALIVFPSAVSAFSNVMLSLAEDVLAAGLTWLAKRQLYIAGTIAAAFALMIIMLIGWDNPGSARSVSRCRAGTRRLNLPAWASFLPKWRCLIPSVGYSLRRSAYELDSLRTRGITGGIVSSMTDWLFMGDLLYKRFDRHPEIWRFPGGKGESKAIAWSTALPFLTCGVFDFVCVHHHLLSYRSTFGLAVAMWFVAPLPMLVAHSIWMKLSAPIAASYAMGWLVKLLIAALSVALVLS